MEIDTEKGRFQKAISEFSTRRKSTEMKLPCYYSCDPTAMAVAIDNNIIQSVDRKFCDVDMTGGPCRGQMIVDWHGVLGKTPNVDIIMEVDVKRVQQFFEEMVQ